METEEPGGGYEEPTGYNPSEDEFADRTYDNFSLRMPPSEHDMDGEPGDATSSSSGYQCIEATDRCKRYGIREDSAWRQPCAAGGAEQA